MSFGYLTCYTPMRTPTHLTTDANICTLSAQTINIIYVPCIKMTFHAEVDKGVAAGMKSEDEMSRIPEALTPQEQAKQRTVLCMKFADVDDLMVRFPFPEELEEEDGIFSWRGKVIVTQDIADDVLRDVFDSFPSSIGRISLYLYLRERYYGFSQPQVQTFLNADEGHQIHKVRYRSQVSRSIIPSQCGHTLMTDCTIMKRQGQNGLLVVMDLFSKRVDARMFRSQTADSIATKFEEMLPGFAGEHKIVRSDNGVEFKAAFAEMVKRLGMTQIRTQPHSPTAAGAIERMNRTVKTLITSCNDQGSFGANLRKAINTINSTVHTVTQFTPNQLNHSDLPADIRLLVRQRLRKAADGERPNDRFQPELHEGDTVRLWVGETQTQQLGLRPGVPANQWKKAIKNHDSTYKPSHEQQWTKKTFTVQKHILSSNLVILKEVPGRRFPRGNVLLVPEGKVDE